MLINLTNHPYELWGEKLRESAAKEYGDVVEMPYPSVDPAWSKQELKEVVDSYYSRIVELKPTAVLAAGEMTFLFMLVDKLLKEGIKVINTCSKRVVTEEKKPDGTSEKKSVFVFECFREYSYYG